MDLATNVLASPRGRFFCANVAYLCSTDPRAADPYRPFSLSDAREVIEGVDISVVSTLSELDLVHALGLATDFARYWQPPDEEDLFFADPDVVDALRPVAEAALSAKRTTWWGDPVELDAQQVVAHPMSPVVWPVSTAPYRPESSGLDEWRRGVVESEARFRVDRSERPDSQLSGQWWSTPTCGGTLATSRARPGLGALELVLEEDSFGGGQARVWPVRVRESPRVYEVSSPADWAHLVQKYPLAVAESRRTVWFETTGQYRDWFIPDWAAVAEDYDGAHLSLHGYLSTPGIAIALPGGDGATVLGGWDPDATFWLNPAVVDIAEEPVLWRRTDRRWEPL